MKKLIPVLRFPEFKGEWEEKRFKEYVTLNQGLQIAIENRYTYNKEGTYFYITNEFLKGSSGKKYYIENPPKNVVCSKTDILMTRTGNTGKVVTNVEGAFHNNFFRINYDNLKINQYFLFHFLNRDIIQHSILTLAGSSTIPDLNHSDFYRLNFVKPSLSEQTKIADFLTQVDEQISLLTEKVTQLQLYKKGVMQKLFSQELRFKDENGKDYPKWEEKKLGEVIKNFIVPMRDKPKSLTGSIPWCRIEDFEGKYLYSSKSNQGVDLKTVKDMNLKIYPVDTLLVSCSANLGICAIVKKPLVTNQTFIGLVPDLDNVNVEFLYYEMGRNAYRLNKLSSGTTISYLSRQQFENFRINIPSLPEQTKIANFLTAIDEQIAGVEQQLEQSRVFKKGLLQGMFV